MDVLVHALEVPVFILAGFARFAVRRFLLSLQRMTVGCSSVFDKRILRQLGELVKNTKPAPGSNGAASHPP